MKILMIPLHEHDLETCPKIKNLCVDNIRSDLIAVEFRNCYSAWAYSIKTKLQTCNLWTGQVTNL